MKTQSLFVVLDSPHVFCYPPFLLFFFLSSLLVFSLSRLRLLGMKSRSTASLWLGYITGTNPRQHSK
jgi:hypothetical protein